MSIINHEQAREIAKEEAKKQIKCNHVFERRHIELLDMNIDVCSKCDITKETYLLTQSKSCFNQYHWYKTKCWVCSIELLCRAKK